MRSVFAAPSQYYYNIDTHYIIINRTVKSSTFAYMYNEHYYIGTLSRRQSRTISIYTRAPARSISRLMISIYIYKVITYNAGGCTLVASVYNHYEKNNIEYDIIIATQIMLYIGTTTDTCNILMMDVPIYVTPSRIH